MAPMPASRLRSASLPPFTGKRARSLKASSRTFGSPCSVLGYVGLGRVGTVVTPPPSSATCLLVRLILRVLCVFLRTRSELGLPDFVKSCRPSSDDGLFHQLFCSFRLCPHPSVVGLRRLAPTCPLVAWCLLLFSVSGHSSFCVSASQVRHASLSVFSRSAECSVVFPVVSLTPVRRHFFSGTLAGELFVVGAFFDFSCGIVDFFGLVASPTTETAVSTRDWANSGSHVAQSLPSNVEPETHCRCSRSSWIAV